MLLVIFPMFAFPKKLPPRHKKSSRKKKRVGDLPSDDEVMKEKSQAVSSSIGFGKDIKGKSSAYSVQCCIYRDYVLCIRRFFFASRQWNLLRVVCHVRFLIITLDKDIGLILVFFKMMISIAQYVFFFFLVSDFLSFYHFVNPSRFAQGSPAYLKQCDIFICKFVVHSRVCHRYSIHHFHS